VAVSFVAAGTIAYATTTPANVVNPTCDVGDLLVMFVGMKPSTANSGSITTPSGWTLVGNLNGAGGYGTTLGVDTGNTNLYIFAKVAVAGDSGASVSVAHATCNVRWAQTQAFRSATGAWTTPHGFASGSDTTAGSVSATLSANPGIATGDMLAWAMCIPTDVTTPSQFSAHTCTATGATIASVTETSEPDTSSGNDLGGFTARASCTAGTATAAPVVGATAGGTTTNVRGPICMIRMREGAAAARNFSINITETGTDTCAAAADVDASFSSAVTETGSDTFAASMTVTDPVRNFSIAITETGPDTMVAAFTARVAFSSAITETGPDTMAASAQVRLVFSSAVTETGPDTMAASVQNRIAISSAITEIGADTLAASVQNRATFSAAIIEVGADTLAANMTVTDPWRNFSISLQETGSDTMVASGTVRLVVSAAITESGADSMAAAATVRVSASMVMSESGPDTLSGALTARVSASLAIQESGPDTMAASAGVVASFSANVTEVGQDTFSGHIGRASFVEFQLDLASSLSATILPAKFRDFEAELFESTSAEYLAGVLHEALVSILEAVEAEAITTRESEGLMPLHEIVDVRFYSFIEGLEKFARYEDVRRRGHDFSCIIPRKI
jgi:hypothetical protein